MPVFLSKVSPYNILVHTAHDALKDNVKLLHNAIPNIDCYSLINTSISPYYGEYANTDVEASTFEVSPYYGYKWTAEDYIHYMVSIPETYIYCIEFMLYKQANELLSDNNYIITTSNVFKMGNTLLLDNGDPINILDGSHSGWAHYAIQSEEGSIRVYKNGSLYSSNSTSSIKFESNGSAVTPSNSVPLMTNISDTVRHITLGNLNTGMRIVGLRITTGAVRYAADFSITLHLFRGWPRY